MKIIKHYKLIRKNRRLQAENRKLQDKLEEKEKANQALLEALK